MRGIWGTSLSPPAFKAIPGFSHIWSESYVISYPPREPTKPSTPRGNPLRQKKNSWIICIFIGVVLATDIVSNKIIFCNFFIYFLFLFFRHALRLVCLQAQITRQTCFQLYPSPLKWEQNIARINGVWQSDPTGPSFSSGGKVSYTETLMLLIFNLAWRSYFIVCCVSHLIPTKFSLYVNYLHS